MTNTKTKNPILSNRVLITVYEESSSLSENSGVDLLDRRSRVADGGRNGSNFSFPIPLPERNHGDGRIFHRVPLRRDSSLASRP